VEQQRRQRQVGRYRPVVLVPRKPRPRPRFRWSIVLVPLALLFAAWVLGNSRPAGTWHEIMECLHVRNAERYTRLACLGVLVVCIVLVVRILDHGRKEKK